MEETRLHETEQLWVGPVDPRTWAPSMRVEESHHKAGDAGGLALHWQVPPDSPRQPLFVEPQADCRFRRTVVRIFLQSYES